MQSFFIAPSSFDVITVTGADALRFLQGQLTCDVAAVDDGNFCYGAACNNKGRVIAAFTLVRVQDVYHLCMTVGLGDILLGALKKYLPFYKCTMQLDTRNLYALAGQCLETVLSHSGSAAPDKADVAVLQISDGWLCKLDTHHPRALLLSSTTFDELRQSLPSCVEAPLEQWEARAMQAGHYPFRATDSEQFTPQELHFDRNGYVSFTKGCYTGQEIVARMHYRGKLKKQLYLLTIENAGAEPADATITLSDAEGIEIGHSLVTRRCNDHVLALAQLPVTLVESDTKLFTAQKKPVHYRPFSIQDDA